ncbi:MAG: hypothetical protein ACK4LT_07930 [Aquificaceae bacterium]
MFNGSINLYQQTKVEQMLQIMTSLHRVVVYSYEVITYIKDIYPDIDQEVNLPPFSYPLRNCE